jgi:hypothetical protein
VKAKEATARIKINRLLEEAGWRFFDDESGTANIVLEPNTKITESQIDALGEDFQTTKNGFIDFLLLDGEAMGAAIERAMLTKLGDALETSAAAHAIVIAAAVDRRTDGGTADGA